MLSRQHRCGSICAMYPPPTALPRQTRQLQFIRQKQSQEEITYIYCQHDPPTKRHSRWSPYFPADFPPAPVLYAKTWLSTQREGADMRKLWKMVHQSSLSRCRYDISYPGLRTIIATGNIRSFAVTILKGFWRLFYNNTHSYYGFAPSASSYGTPRPVRGIALLFICRRCSYLIGNTSMGLHGLLRI
jgi:hypothetical protein